MKSEIVVATLVSCLLGLSLALNVSQYQENLELKERLDYYLHEQERLYEYWQNMPSLSVFHYVNETGEILCGVATSFLDWRDGKVELLFSSENDVEAIDWAMAHSDFVGQVTDYLALNRTGGIWKPGG